MLSEEETQQLIMAACATQPTTEDDLKRIHEWASNVRMDAALLDSVLKGDMGVKWGDGEPAFVLTDQGKRRVDSMLPGEPSEGP